MEHHGEGHRPRDDAHAVVVHLHAGRQAGGADQLAAPVPLAGDDVRQLYTVVTGDFGKGLARIDQLADQFRDGQGSSVAVFFVAPFVTPGPAVWGAAGGVEFPTAHLRVRMQSAGFSLKMASACASVISG